MGYYVLHDTTTDRAIIFDSTSERPLDHAAFIGSDAREQGEDFLAWLDCDPRDWHTLGAKGYHRGPFSKDGAHYPALDHAISAWGRDAFDRDANFVGTVRS